MEPQAPNECEDFAFKEAAFSGLRWTDPLRRLQIVLGAIVMIMPQFLEFGIHQDILPEIVYAAGVALIIIATLS